MRHAGELLLQEDEDEEQNEYEQDGFIVDDAEEEEEEEEERVAPKRRKKKKRERELRLDDDDYDLLEENQVQVRGSRGTTAYRCRYGAACGHARTDVGEAPGPSAPGFVAGGGGRTRTGAALG